MHDVAIIGGGLSGMATALLLQSRGKSTLVIEGHSRPGGCAGFYARKGFSFDVGATTLVDFHAEGLGGHFLSEVGLGELELEFLPGYKAWFPDITVDVAREQIHWHRERLRKLGDTKQHRRFWQLLDHIAQAYWGATRRGIRLPMSNVSDVLNNARALDLSGIWLSRYLSWSLGDALRHFSLANDRKLVGLLAMMVEDTVHAKLESAPLINSALGISIRGAGLSRPPGGMRGFWRKLIRRYVDLGGQIKFSTRVERITGALGDYRIAAASHSFHARQVVCALPLQSVINIAPDCLKAKAQHYIRRDADSLGGGLVLCLGVPDSEVAETHNGHRHHQIMRSYDDALGNGNNMFISVSAAEDRLSAPAGQRAVMISTHCELEDWSGLAEREYKALKVKMTERLIRNARQVYPRLATNPSVCELGTPRTYEQYTRRPEGAVGGVRLNMKNSNQYAIPYNIGHKGFWLAGDTAWPGLGTVSCVMGARHIARGVGKLLA